jgi:hypothetical protein
MGIGGMRVWTTIGAKGAKGAKGGGLGHGPGRHEPELAASQAFLALVRGRQIPLTCPALVALDGSLMVSI